MGNPYSVYVLLGLFWFTAPRNDVIVISYDKFPYEYLSHIAAFWMMEKLSLVTGLLFSPLSNTASTRYNMHTFTMLFTSAGSNVVALNVFIKSFKVTRLIVPKYFSYRVSSRLRVSWSRGNLPQFSKVTMANAMRSNLTPIPLKLNSITLGSSHSTCRTNKLWTTALQNVIDFNFKKWPKQVFLNSLTPRLPSFYLITSTAFDRLPKFVTFAPLDCLSNGMIKLLTLVLCKKYNMEWKKLRKQHKALYSPIIGESRQ